MLTAALSSFRDLYAKLLRDRAALDNEVTSDKLFNFAVTGYSLIDWAKNDPTVSAMAAADVGRLYQNQWLRICGDIAIGMKHFTLTKRVPVTASVVSEQGFGLGRYGKGNFGEGEESIEISLLSGVSVDCLAFADAVVAEWGDFIRRHGI